MSYFRDVPKEKLGELANYLKRFSADEEEDEQYWYLLACTLRKRNRKKCNYSEVFLVSVGQYEDKAALTFLKDLRKRDVSLEEVVTCLEIIKCQGGVNVLKHGATTPEILRPVKDQVLKLKRGETVTLGVEAVCRPGPLEYAWFCGDQPLPGENSSQLSLHGVTTAHQGQYYCSVTNPAINNPQLASATSPSVRLEVQDLSAQSNGAIIRQETVHKTLPPVITTHPKDVHVRRGRKLSSVTFQCKAEQDVVYDWYKDGKLYIENGSGQLVLRPVRAEHAGEYYCKVVNDGGSEQSTIATLTFVSDIEVTDLSPQGTEKDPTILRVGEQLELACTATSPSGNQLAYQWFRTDRGKLITPISQQQTFSSKISPEGLTSRRTLQFRCKVTDSCDASNYVLSPTVVIKVDTVWITEEPSTVHAVIKERAQLSCAAKGCGPFSYIWLKGSTSNGRPAIYRQTKLGVLPFNKLRNEDAGYYQCQVENKWQRVDSKIVQVKPLLSYESSSPVPVIRSIRQPRSCVVQKGTCFRLLFEVVCSTQDPVIYQWYFQGSKINGASSTAYIREHMTLEDRGPYWCEARAGAACVVSESARVELQYEEVKPANSNWERHDSERFFRTLTEERYAREKVALLIGNCDYQHEELGELKTPKNDVVAVQKVLTQDPFNFKVISLVDVNHAEMRAALELFYELLLVPGTYALFYFSGHGFSTSNRNNYLVPVDSPPDSASCYQVDSIIKEMQKKLSRAILFLDACRVVKDKVNAEDDSYSSIANLSNIYEEWSCMDNTTAADSASPLDTVSESVFNKAFVQAIRQKHGLPAVHEQIMQVLLESGVAQRPMSRTGMSDGRITLQDPIMIDDRSLEKNLDLVLNTHTLAHSVPDPHTFKGVEMRDLQAFAELNLTFSLQLTNVLRIEATLHQLHDKTSSASIEFEREDFLTTQGVSSTQEAPPHLDGQEEGQCARAILVVRGLQKLKAPLKLLIKACLWESGQERTTKVMYHFKDMPLIAKK